MPRLPGTLVVRFEPPPDRCPHCGGSRVARIRYGRVSPTKKVREEIARGEYVLGGCVIGDDAPTWQCLDCKSHGGRRTVEPYRPEPSPRKPKTTRRKKAEPPSDS